MQLHEPEPLDLVERVPPMRERRETDAEQNGRRRRNGRETETEGEKRARRLWDQDAKNRGGEENEEEGRERIVCGATKEDGARMRRGGKREEGEGMKSKIANS